MRLIDRFEVEQSHVRSTNDLWGAPTTSTLEIVSRASESLPDFANVYSLVLILRIQFTANKAQYTRALENAKMQATRNLYSDIQNNIQSAMTAIYNNDASLALKHLHDVDQICTGADEETHG